MAYVGTHRHSPSGDGAYEFTYMFKYGSDISKGATEVTLPNDPCTVVERGFNPAQVRYLRLLVTNPTQKTGNMPTRICELEVY